MALRGKLLAEPTKKTPGKMKAFNAWMPVFKPEVYDITKTEWDKFLKSEKGPIVVGEFTVIKFEPVTHRSGAKLATKLELEKEYI